MIRVGVVGVGAMGQHHARIYSKLDCQLVGVADKNLKRAREVGERYGAEYCRDYEKLLNKVEAVSIAVPTSLHRKVSMDFIRRGVHCLVEKPIATTVKEAREMIVEVEKRGAKLMIGHVERFNPAVAKLKKLVDGGALGKPIIVSTRRVGPHVPRIKDVGIIIDAATHDIDIVRYLLRREPVNVFAKFGRIQHEKEDHAIIVLDFGDVAASMEVNWFTPYKERTLVITGTKGIAHLDYIKQKVEIYSSRGKQTHLVKKEEPLKLELKHFLNCIKNDREPLVNGSEGLKTLEIALKACEGQ